MNFHELFDKLSSIEFSFMKFSNPILLRFPLKYPINSIIISYKSKENPDVVFDEIFDEMKKLQDIIGESFLLVSISHSIRIIEANNNSIIPTAFLELETVVKHFVHNAFSRENENNRWGEYDKMLRLRYFNAIDFSEEFCKERKMIENKLTLLDVKIMYKELMESIYGK